MDDATRRANDAMERAIARQSVPAELAAYRLEAVLCRLEDASPAWWEGHAHLTPAALLAAAAEDHAADTREEDPHR